MIWFFYNLLFPIGFVLMLPKFLWRMCRRGGYRDRFGQRFGLYDPAVRTQLAAAPRLWIHAVSVGEMFVALDFIRAYRAREPQARFVVTTVTSTGRALALEKADPADVVLYFPLDFPPIVRRALDAIRPRKIILTESELWPNFLRQAHARGIPIAVINARITEKSARGYRLLAPLTRIALSCFDRIFAQCEGDRRRYVSLGAPSDRVEVLGSVKYDQAPDPGGAERAEAVLKRAGWGQDTLILLGGSTWPGEETALAEAFQRLRTGHPALRLILVPRHAERAGDVESLLEQQGLRFLRRSALEKAPAAVSPDVLLVDTTGELKSFYSAAHVVFVGKSMFENHGGQNIIEPAVYGKPVLAGPHLENFPGVADDLREADALIQVADIAELTRQVDRLLRDPRERDARGHRAAALVARRRGVMAATVERMRALGGTQT